MTCYVIGFLRDQTFSYFAILDGETTKHKYAKVWTSFEQCRYDAEALIPNFRLPDNLEESKYIGRRGTVTWHGCPGCWIEEVNDLAEFISRPDTW